MPVGDKKRAYGVKLVDFVENYKSIFIVECDNVGSKQMQQIRYTLRGQAEVLMGKNTTVRKVLKDYLKKNEGHPIEALLEHVVGNVGLVFTNAGMAKIRDVISANKVPAPARVGGVAPIDVFVEPGPTGCDPGQTAWFQALNIPTKINKGQIEMVSRVHLIHKGTKVTESQAALLAKLNIKPFSYGLVVTKVYDAGTVFEVAVLDIDESDLLTKFFSGVSTLAAASIGLGYPTVASIVHSVNDAFKTLIAVALGTYYTFPKAKEFADFIANPGSFASAAPAGGKPAAGGAAPAAAAKKEEEPEEEEVVAGGGLFGDDEDF